MGALTNFRDICHKNGMFTMNYAAILDLVSEGVLESAISKRLDITRQSVAMALNIMEVSGIVSKERPDRKTAKDKRRCVISTTTEGEALLESIHKYFTRPKK